MSSFARRDRGSFKAGVSNDDSRRRREDTSVQLRKSKREEGLAKRRQMASAPEPAPAPAPGTDAHAATQAVPAPRTYTAADIPELAAVIAAACASGVPPNAETVLPAVKGFRRILSIEPSPPVLEVLTSGVVPHFIAFLTRSDAVDLQFESAWALTNIASTDQTRAVVEAGTVPHLCNLLLSPSANVREQAAWCLGNIAGDGAELRDHVLQCGALPPLLQNVLQPASISMLRNTVWALSNFCRGKPQPALATVAAAVPVLAQIMAQQTDKEVLMDACWAMSYLSDGENARVEAVVQTGVMGRLVQLLGHESPSVITPALRTVGNIVSGDDKQTQSMVDAGCVRAVLPLLGHVKKGIRKEACWMLSNIAAGTHDQITALLQHRDVMDGVLGHVRGDEWDVRKEAAWVLSNVATGGTHEQVFALVKNHRCVEELCSLLDCADVKILQVALDALEALLKCDSKSSGLLQVPSLVDEADGLDKLENLQEHENQSVYEKAVRLIETYFGSDDDEEGENIAPASDGATFSFGLPAAGSAGMAPKLGEGFGAGFPAAPAFNAAATFNANSFNFNVAN